MSRPYKLDRVAGGVLADDGIEEQKLKQAAGMGLSSTEAQEVWPQVLEHKWYLSERLGRDVGLRVAAIDYFENVRKVRKREQVQETLPPTLPYMRPLGYR